MDGIKITHQRDGRVESYSGRHKSNSPNGWTDGELYGDHIPKAGELNVWHENNSSKG